jgi:hypothetical protein
MSDGQPELPMEARRDLAFHACTREIMDFRQIYRSDQRKPGKTGLITIQEMIARHETSRTYIKEELEKPFAGKTIVLSHHAPSPRSFHPSFMGLASNAAYASDLSSIIENGSPYYWIHGHIHYSSDYIEGGTRILCNPQGYRHERDLTGFRPGLVVEL